MSENQTRRRVTYTQLLHLWESLNKHREIAVGYNKSAQAREHSKRMWEKIASLLNSFGEGSVKSGSEWSKYWVDYKAKIKRKNRLINEAGRRTGGGPSTDLELSEIDRKFLSILGEDYGLGLPGIQVDPLVTQEHLDSNINRPGTSQSTTDERPLYLEVDFHENENQQRESESIPSSFSQTSSHQEHIAQVQEDSQSSSAPIQACVSGQQCASTIAQLATQNSTPQQANTQQTPRRRQRGRRRLTAADAREQLVAAAQSRAQAELANSRSLQQAIGVLGDMVSILRRIETKFPGEAPTNE